jgi:hypothetical protein
MFPSPGRRFSFLVHNEKTRADTGSSVSNAGSVKPALAAGDEVSAR